MDQISFHGCFGSGLSNDSGLKAVFRTMEDGRVEGVFIGGRQNVGHPDSVRVGPLVGCLSETMGRPAFQKDMYYPTQSIGVTFKCGVSPRVKTLVFATLKRLTAHHLVAEAEM